nr:zinc finger protein ZAT9-like [Tanacetum cinerariifolium]
MINKRSKSSSLSCNSNVVSDGSGGDGGHVVDLNKYLKGWSVTERRGRRCTTCNKCFSSHQALGGHRSSHNKVAKKIISDDDFVGENVVKEAEFA